MATIREFKAYEHEDNADVTDRDYSDGMYFWTYEGDRYRTNANGEGIWRKDTGRENWRQIAGLSQFSVLGKRRSDAWKKIRRHFAN